jgi:iron-sulfur cluster assembly protein
MLTVTDDAAEAIKAIVQSNSGGDTLRLVSRPMNENEATLDIEIAAEPAPTDQSVQAGDVQLYMDASAAAFLEDKELDATVEGDSVRFSIGDQAS